MVLVQSHPYGGAEEREGEFEYLPFLFMVVPVFCPAPPPGPPFHRSTESISGNEFTELCKSSQGQKPVMDATL